MCVCLKILRRRSPDKHFCGHSSGHKKEALGKLKYFLLAILIRLNVPYLGPLFEAKVLTEESQTSECYFSQETPLSWKSASPAPACSPISHCGLVHVFYKFFHGFLQPGWGRIDSSSVWSPWCLMLSLSHPCYITSASKQWCSTELQILTNTALLHTQFFPFVC